MQIMKPVPIAISIWLILWVNFIARDLYKSGYINDYKILIRLNAEGKSAYTYGRPFYEFLKFAKANIPEGAYYEFAGVEDGSLDSRRGIYYLYPCLKSKDAKYLLVYARVGTGLSSGSPVSGQGLSPLEAEFERYATLDQGRYILKRR